MVKLSKQMKRQLVKSLKEWRGEVSFRDTELYNKGDCDICEHATQMRLDHMEIWFPTGTNTEGDPPWLFCEEHGKEFGLAW